MDGRQKKELIEVVYREYGQFSVGKLVELTHEETSWKEMPEGEVISLEKMERFFSDKTKKA